MRDGIPTYFQLQTDSDLKDEGNMPKSIRNLRCASTSVSITGVVLAFLTLFAKPRPTPRKLLSFLAAFLLIAGMSISWVAFGIGENDARRSKRCPELVLFTNEKCDKREGPAVAANILDFLLGISGITAFISLIYTTITGDFKLNREGWRQQDRDAELEPPKKNKHNIKPHNVRKIRLAFTAISLVFVLLIASALIVFIVVLHQDHQTVNLRSIRGRTNRSFDPYSDKTWEEAGWPAKNTRLRYAYSGIGILTVLANLLPWRSRVIAYVFAFLYFSVFVLAIVSFAIDVHELRKARNTYGCATTGGNWLYGVRQDALVGVNLPTDLSINCINSPYVATAIFDFIAAISLLIYLFNEYIVRYKSIHSGRKYPWFHIRKIEKELDSRRPVRCELTSQVMTAAEYYYRHRFLTEHELAATSGSSDSSASLADFPAYDPAIRQFGL